MEDTKIELPSINQICDKVFCIPTYQRGYRWTKQQVEDLLNDVNEFKKGEDGAFYCLQPLVICEQRDQSFNVIDGQQRLTTLYLILKEFSKEDLFTLRYKRNDYIEQVCKIEIPDDFQEEFAQFWKRISAKNPEYDTIELYYLLNARYTIKKWRNNFAEGFIEKLKNDVKFIWYPILDTAKEHEYFKNLNSGKIPLTNAELIKALFLRTNGNNSISKSLIADEFDQFERALRFDDFWYFLAGGKDKPSSCIELLFNLMLDSSSAKNSFKDKEFRTFFYFKEKEKEVSWEDVRKTFYILDGWYNNPSIYNLIGYLRACEGNEFSLDSIFCLYNNSKSKEDFVKELIEKCKESIDYKNDKYLNLKYKDKKIRNLLLFLNIATLLNNPETKTKFQFAAYHKENWDVEHISPQNPKTEDILGFIKERYKDTEIPSVIEKILKDHEKNDEEKKKDLINSLFVNDSVLNTLSNHTLLTDHTNRGIGNGFFFEKRQQLIKYYQKGYYIPPCSMNVFQKFYTQEPDNMDFWDETDQKQYLEKISFTVKEFFRKDLELWKN